jgi:hypothetical protein
MFRTFMRSTAFPRRKGTALLIAAISCLLSSQFTFAAGLDSSTPSAPVQSDQAAVQAMRNVIVQSGGVAAWQQIRSAKEAFSVLSPGEKTPQVALFLDDWSLATTRYRRRMRGQTNPPGDHNGDPTYPTDMGSTHVMTPEFDQARVLLNKLPAAAAEVMLRRPEYVLQVSKSPCEAGMICIDVFRILNSTMQLLPEQQWKINATSGLPASIRYWVPSIGASPGRLLKEVHFLQYATEDGLVLPVSIMTKFGSLLQAWNFISFKSNPGFDTSKFDREDAQ